MNAAGVHAIVGSAVGNGIKELKGFGIETVHLRIRAVTTDQNYIL